MATIEAESTPNPNSLKFTVSGGSFRHNGVESFSSSDDAADHSLARRLFSIGEIDDVFITPDFITVTKHPRAEWKDRISKIKSILTSHLDEAE